MAQIGLHALPFGKESSATDVADTRVILPLPSVLGLLDAILPALIEPLINRLLPCPDSVWFGALPRTQVLDISQGLAAVIEKACWCCRTVGRSPILRQQQYAARVFFSLS